MRSEHLTPLIISLSVVMIYLYVVFFFPSIFPTFLAEFLAGFAGILLGFNLDRYLQLWRKKKISEQIINTLLVELGNNLDLVKRFKSEIDMPTIHRYPRSGRGAIKVFDLFQTSAWYMFSSRLELDAIEILYDLGTVYHKFELFNEGIKNEATGGTLEILLKRNPKFLEELEKDLESIIERLDNLLK